MAYDAKLAERIRRVVAGKPGMTEKAMFGGVAFLLNGKMFCGVANEDLMVRVGPQRHEEALPDGNLTEVSFEHGGWRGETPEPVVQGWRHFVGSLRSFAETGKGQPSGRLRGFHAEADVTPTLRLSAGSSASP